MKDLKHIKRFNESDEHMDIELSKDTSSDIDLEQLAKDVFEEQEGYSPVSYTDMKSVELIQAGIEAGLRYAK